MSPFKDYQFNWLLERNTVADRAIWNALNTLLSERPEIYVDFEAQKQIARQYLRNGGCL